MSESPGNGTPVLSWRRQASGNYYAEDRSLGALYLVGKLSPSGARRWFVEAWPTALPDAKNLVRTEYGLRTMADAQAMAAGMPCFRCGRGRPLILVERYSPRWRCIHRAECEAERARLLAAGSRPGAIEQNPEAIREEVI